MHVDLPVEVGTGSSLPGHHELVLVVDQHGQRREQIVRALAGQGIESLAADTAGAAQELVAQRPPTVTLVGSVGDDRADIELCRALRRDWRWGNPAIVLLVDRTTGERDPLLAVEADESVPAVPFDAALLGARVASVLSRTRAIRGASPLTGLPGNLAIDAELRRRTGAGEPTALLYCDLDNFKAYNDRYGFLRGDAVISALAEILRSATATRPDTFVGHVGGDDFVVIARPVDAPSIAEAVVRAFDDRMAGFHDPDEAARGWIAVRDRRGRRRRFPLVSVSIGIARSPGGPGDHRAVVATATEMKRYAKSRPGSAVAVDRRSRPGPEPLVRPRRGPPATHDRRSRRPRHRPSRHLLASVLALLLVTGPATGALAWSADPGDALWHARLWLEERRLDLTTDPVRRAELQLGLAGRRLGDVTALVADDADPELIEAAAADLERRLVAAAQMLGRLDPHTPDEQVAHLKDVLAHHLQMLDVLAGAGCSDAGPGGGACARLRRALRSVSPTGQDAPPGQAQRPAGAPGEGDSRVVADRPATRPSSPGAIGAEQRRRAPRNPPHAGGVATRPSTVDGAEGPGRLGGDGDEPGGGHVAADRPEPAAAEPGRAPHGPSPDPAPLSDSPDASQPGSDGATHGGAPGPGQPATEPKPGQGHAGEPAGVRASVAAPRADRRDGDDGTPRAVAR